MKKIGQFFRFVSPHMNQPANHRQKVHVNYRTQTLPRNCPGQPDEFSSPKSSGSRAKVFKNQDEQKADRQDGRALPDQTCPVLRQCVPLQQSDKRHRF